MHCVCPLVDLLHAAAPACSRDCCYALAILCINVHVAFPGNLSLQLLMLKVLFWAQEASKAKTHFWGVLYFGFWKTHASEPAPPDLCRLTQHFVRQGRAGRSNLPAAADKSHTAAHRSKPKHSVLCARFRLSVPLVAVPALSLQASIIIPGYASDKGLPLQFVHKSDLTYSCSACCVAL